MSAKSKYLFCIFCLWAGALTAQQGGGEVMLERGPFSRTDSLRGSLNPWRSCFDVLHYDLNLRIDMDARRIRGHNRITLRWLQAADSLQLDAFPELQVDSVTCRGRALPLHRLDYSLRVAASPQWQAGDTLSLTVWYQGKPREAPNPPWDGGFVWKKDREGRPWLTMACEGLGASMWWPCKDHLSDEPDQGMRIAVQLPASLELVTNGWRKSVLNHRDGTRTHEWLVSYPINLYNVSLYVGHYAHIAEEYEGLQGPLKLDYYVLDYNKARAGSYFSQQVKPMLQCFEERLGPYPFYKDGFALAETPYWGMEHQGAIAYGNHFRPNEWGFDYIIVHESGHEWFGNHISVADHADMWIHEAFTTYTEAIYMECLHGYARAQQYLLSQRPLIANQDAIQGPLGVNFEDWKSADMYYKGAWMLHTLRTVVDNDSLWWTWFPALYKDLGMRQVSRADVITHAERHFGRPLQAFFHQYLDYAGIPVLEYALVPQTAGVQVLARWRGVSEGFDMPVSFRPATSPGDTVSVSYSIQPGVGEFTTTLLPGATGQDWAPDTDRLYISAAKVNFSPARTLPAQTAPDKLPQKLRKRERSRK
ncbi:MAG: M1 family metallopeptidase [Bacteroidetes bacterium]|nr:M1 family metallopeptidase [Bacteroidota bacterium]